MRTQKGLQCPRQSRLSHPRKWTILALVLAAECMDLLDGTIVNVAAPTIRDDLHAGSSALQWIIGGYALTFAVGLIAGGRLGDIYGRRRLFVIGALGFVVASMACAFAASPEMLIGCRLPRARAAALLIPQGLGIIRDAFAGADLRTAFARVRAGDRAVGGARADHRRRADRGQRVRERLAADLLRQPAARPDRGDRRGAADARVPRRPAADASTSSAPRWPRSAMGLLIYPLIQGREAGWPAWTYLMIAGSAVVVRGAGGCGAPCERGVAATR